MQWPHERQIMTDSRNHHTTTGGGGGSKHPTKAPYHRRQPHAGPIHYPH